MRESASVRPGPATPLPDAGEAPDAGEVRRNIGLLILNGGLMFMAMTFVSANMVLPAFVQMLTASSVMIGVVGGLMRVGWAWPQVFISRVVEPLPRKMPVLLWTGGLRSALWFLIGGLTAMLGDRSPGLLLGVFIGLYALATSMMGISNVPWMDIIGKAVPSGERVRMFALRRLLGGVTAMAAGVAISYVLSARSGLRFPDNYAVLFLLSGVGTAVAIGILGLIREPVEPVRSRRLPIGAYLASGFMLLREDANYRRLCMMQFLWAFSMMASPFYVPYALTTFRIGTAYVGIFVSVMQFSTVVSNVLWAYVGHRRGNRALLVYGSYLLALCAAAPLLALWMPDRSVVPFALFGLRAVFNLRISAFGLTFVLFGFATSAMFTGRMAYVLDIAPSDRRPTYTSFMNMFMLPQGLLPVLAGALAAWISYRSMFGIALAFAPASIWMAHRLKDIRKSR